MKLKLEQLKPEPAKFFCRSLNRELTIRVPSLADDAWLRSTWGDEIEKALQTAEGMCRFVYQLLIEEDRALFKTKSREYTDDDGNPKEEQIGGWRAFMAAIDSMAGKIAMADALLRARGFARPIIDEIVAEELKKKETPASQSKSPTGETSLTSSPPSTDGPGRTSGPSPSAKSPSPSSGSEPGASSRSSSRRPSTASSSSRPGKPRPPRGPARHLETQKPRREPSAP